MCPFLLPLCAPLCADVPSALQPSDPYATLVYFDQCGWTGLNWQGTRRRRFRFADSHITGSYKDAGAPDTAEVVLADFATSEFAGAVCVSGERYLCDDGVSVPVHAPQCCACCVWVARPRFLSALAQRGPLQLLLHVACCSAVCVPFPPPPLRPTS
jgi:hypothetical protein